MNTSILYPVTLIIVGLLVLVLVIYLVLIIVALWRGGTKLKKLAGGLQQIADNTEPLSVHLNTINGALGSLPEELFLVDKHLLGIAKILKL